MPGTLPALVLWKTGTWKQIKAIKPKTGNVHDVAFSPDGSEIIASAANVVERWDWRDRELKQELTTRQDTITQLTCSADQTWIAAGNEDCTINMWNTPDATVTKFKGHWGAVTDVSFSPNCLRLASAGADATVRIWNTTGLQGDTRGGSHTGEIVDVAAHPKQPVFASGGFDNTIRLWDFRSGQLQRTLSAHTSAVTDLAYSHDGAWLASASRDATVRIWPVDTAAFPAEQSDVQSTHVLRGEKIAVLCVNFSPDSKRIVSSGYDGTVRIWSVATGELLHEITGHNGRVWQAVFSVDGDSVITSGLDQTLRFWKLTDTDVEPFRTINAGTILYTLALSPDGSLIACGGRDTNIQLRDAKTGELVRTMRGHFGLPSALQFNQDGT
ncbi:MAG: WD40 repeat domain-containing protein, partial [Planctomycetota bacterium]